MDDSTEPLLKWPNREALWQATIEAIWNAHYTEITKDAGTEELYDWADQGDDPPITQEEAHKIAPALREAVKKAAEAYEPPEYLLQILTDEVYTAARTLIGQIPEDQQDKLFSAMKAANEETSPE